MTRRDNFYEGTGQPISPDPRGRYIETDAGR